MKKSLIICSLLLILVLSFELEEVDITIVEQITDNNIDDNKDDDEYFNPYCSPYNYTGCCQITFMIDPTISAASCIPDYSGCVLRNPDNSCATYGFGIFPDGTGVLNCLLYNSDGITCNTCQSGFTLDDINGTCNANNCNQIDYQNNGVCTYGLTSIQCDQGFQKNGYGCISNSVIFPTGCYVLNSTNILKNSKNISNCLYCKNGILCASVKYNVDILLAMGPGDL